MPLRHGSKGQTRTPAESFFSCTMRNRRRGDGLWNACLPRADKQAERSEGDEQRGSPHARLIALAGADEQRVFAALLQAQRVQIDAA